MPAQNCRAVQKETFFRKAEFKNPGTVTGSKAEKGKQKVITSKGGREKRNLPELGGYKKSISKKVKLQDGRGGWGPNDAKTYGNRD